MKKFTLFRAIDERERERVKACCRSWAEKWERGFYINVKYFKLFDIREWYWYSGTESAFALPAPGQGVSKFTNRSLNLKMLTIEDYKSPFVNAIWALLMVGPFKQRDNNKIQWRDETHFKIRESWVWAFKF